MRSTKRTMTRHLELTLPAVPAKVRDAREAVASLMVELGADEDTVDDVRLCVSEAVANVVRHAYADGGELLVRVEEQAGEVTVVVGDEGSGLSGFRSDGDLGYGLRIIDRLAARCAITSAPNLGTEVQMVFPLRRGSTG